MGDLPGDRAIRAIEEHGAFRVITLRSTDTATRVAAAQGVSGPTAARLAELLTGAILVRETMAPTLRVQCIVSGATGGSLVADSHPDGSTRGLVNAPPSGSPFSLGEGSLLKVLRVMPRGSLHESVVVAGRPGGLSEALMEYMQSSEQVTSMLAIGAIADERRVVAAGGYIVQLLPEVKTGPLAIMAERLEDFRHISTLLLQHDADPAWLLSELLYGFAHEILEHRPVSFGCQCSAVRVISAMSTLGREELDKLVAEGTVLDIDCDYCATRYQVGPEQLRSLLAPPS